MVHSAKGSQAWAGTVSLFEDGPAEFGRHYHARPTVESIFNSVKARCGNALRCTDRIAQRREIGLRAICHNTNTANKPRSRPAWACTDRAVTRGRVRPRRESPSAHRRLRTLFRPAAGRPLPAPPRQPPAPGRPTPVRSFAQSGCHSAQFLSLCDPSCPSSLQTPNLHA